MFACKNLNQITYLLMITKTEYKGDWFIPNSEARYPGILKIHKRNKEITLTIYSENYIDGAPVNDRNMSNPIANPMIILGGITQPITLYDCRWIGTNYISDKVNKITYRIDFVFEFAHFRRAEDIILTAAYVKYPYLATWYDGWVASLSKEEEVLKLPVESLDITDGVTITYRNEIIKDKNRIGDVYKKNALFQYRKGPAFSVARVDWWKFASLLQLATSKDINYELVSITVDKSRTMKFDKIYSHECNDNEIRCLVHNFSFSENEVVKSDWIHQNSMIFSTWKLSKETLNEIIIAWYANQSLYPIYDYYIDSNIWPKTNRFKLSNVMFNNKFLNLIQGLEAYHFQLNEAYEPNNKDFVANRQKILNLLDRDGRIWLKNNLKFPKEFKLYDRLYALVQKFDKPLQNILHRQNHIQYFPEKAKELRHKLSHGNLESTYQGETLNHLFYTAQFLMCMCILQSLGLEEHNIINTLRHNYHFDRVMGHAIHHFTQIGDGK